MSGMMKILMRPESCFVIVSTLQLVPLLDLLTENRPSRKLMVIGITNCNSETMITVRQDLEASSRARGAWKVAIRSRTEGRVHFWPFDGWKAPPGKSVVAEVYPALWSHTWNSDQHDAYSVTEWLRRSDLDGSLHRFFNPLLNEHESKMAEIEGWILGIA